MTGSGVVLESESGFAPRTTYLKTIALRADTVALAEDANAIQANTEEALSLFAADVDAALRAMLRGVVGRLMLSERQQAAYEAALNTSLAAFRSGIDARLAAFITEVAARDAEVLRLAKAYTDAQIASVRGTLLDSTKRVVVFETGELNDGGNAFGGKNWTFTVMDIPGGTTLRVHRWAFNWVATGDQGGSNDEATLTWPTFAGSAVIGGTSPFETQSGARSETPLFSLRGPATVGASLYINNLKGRGVFTVDGFLVPDALGV